MSYQQIALASAHILALLLFTACSGGGSGGGATATTGTGGGGGTGGNNAPVFTSSPGTTATEGQPYIYQATATDADADPLTFALIVAPTGMSVNGTSGLVSWTPGSTHVGNNNVTLQVSDGTDNTNQSWIIVVASAGGGGGGLPASLTLTSMGTLPNSMKVLSDMVEFDGKLYIAAAQDPLNSPFGAGVYYYDGSNIQTSFYDSGSQGFLRTKVIDNKLYIPDGDPNGMTNGIVYIYSTGSVSPLSTVVTAGVHNFDVVKFNNELYVSGSNTSGSSTLHKFNSSTSVWDLASTGSYGRLKYMAILDNKIWSSKQIQTGVDGVWVDAAMAQSGFNLSSSGGSLIPMMENIGNDIYMTVWESGGSVSNVRVQTGSSVTTLTGVSGVVWDIIKHTDGNYYAIGTDTTSDYIWGSTNGVAFTELYKGAAGPFNIAPAGNADGRPSIASYNGSLYAGSSTNGKLYKLN